MASGVLLRLSRSIIRPTATNCRLQQTSFRPLLVHTNSCSTSCAKDNEIGMASGNGETFEEMLESSPLMKIRRPQGLAVNGKITNICNDDLYVDFGGKFEVVVKRPSIRADEYKIGSKVRVMLRKFEMTGHFLGQNKHITLLEADGSLLGIEPKKTKTK
eukprot:gene12264-13530_t